MSTERYLDHIMDLAQKSCPASVAQQGSIELWDKNRQFVIAGIELIRLCAREASTAPHQYKELSDIAIALYDGLCRTQASFTDNLLGVETEFMDIIEVGKEVSQSMYSSIDALLTFDEIDKAHKQARKTSPKWREN